MPSDDRLQAPSPLGDSLSPEAEEEVGKAVRRTSIQELSLSAFQDPINGRELSPRCFVDLNTHLYSQDQQVQGW